MTVGERLGVCYTTPEGYSDSPYIYIFSGASLEDNGSYPNLAVPIAGDADFILRRIVGADYLLDTTGTFQYFNASRAPAYSAPLLPFFNTVVLPEKLYPAGSQLRLELTDVARANNLCSQVRAYFDQIAFQGVRRWLGRGIAPGKTPYRYYEAPYTYRYDLTIDWAGVAGAGIAPAPRRFDVQVENYDFELHTISIYEGVAGAMDALTAGRFQILLYDAGSHMLMSDLANAEYINWLPIEQVTDPNVGLFQFSAFPCPPVLYPATSRIALDVRSLICEASLPQSFVLLFRGAQRRPC